MRPPSRMHARTLRRTVAVSAAAFTGLSLVFTATGPANAVEPAPSSEAEAEQIVEDRQSEDSSALTAQDVPRGVSLEEARDAVDESDEITPADLEYAAALEDVAADAADASEDFYTTPAQLPDGPNSWWSRPARAEWRQTPPPAHGRGRRWMRKLENRNS